MRKTRLTRQDTLKAKPIRNEAVKESRGKDGVVLVIPGKKARWVRIFSKLFAIPEEKKIYLDDIGGWVWHRCDGRVSVGKMIEDLAREYKINSKEAEISLLSYLKKLAQKRLIGFLMEKQGKDVQ